MSDAAHNLDTDHLMDELRENIARGDYWLNIYKMAEVLGVTPEMSKAGALYAIFDEDYDTHEELAQRVYIAVELTKRLSDRTIDPEVLAKLRLLTNTRRPTGS